MARDTNSGIALKDDDVSEGNMNERDLQPPSSWMDAFGAAEDT
jgi:hypothetical protein